MNWKKDTPWRLYNKPSIFILAFLESKIFFYSWQRKINTPKSSVTQESSHFPHLRQGRISHSWLRSNSFLLHLLAIEMKPSTRKKPPFLLLSSLFCVFLLASILYTGNNWKFHVEREAPSACTFPPPDVSAHKNKTTDFGGHQLFLYYNIFLFLFFYYIYLDIYI